MRFPDNITGTKSFVCNNFVLESAGWGWNSEQRRQSSSNTETGSFFQSLAISMYGNADCRIGIPLDSLAAAIRLMSERKILNGGARRL